jgi:hypothetical protein
MPDVKALIRMMLRDWIPCGGVIFMLAVAIAAATTTFAVADAVLWRQLPYRDPERLAVLLTRQSVTSATNA